MSFVIKARTALALGVPNLVRALTYRLGVKTGLNPVRRLKGERRRAHSLRFHQQGRPIPGWLLRKPG
jgi:hypothetical protein